MNTDCLSAHLRSELSAAHVRLMLDYNPETGVFTWRKRPREHFKTSHDCLAWNTRYEGSKAGSRKSNGYLDISIDGIRYLAHRMAWLWMTGEWPTHEVDHRDRDKLNNCWANLRAATRRENECNKLPSSKNTSGHKGVSWKKQRRKWQVCIGVDGKRIHLGVFDEDRLEHAIAAYAMAAREYHGEFALDAGQRVARREGER